MRFALAILLATAVPFGGDIVLAQDEDGCSKGPGPGSISTDSKWVSEFGSRRFVATYTNNSDQRIYATFCNQKRDDPTDEGYCGSDGIRPGGRTTWAHYEEQTTGEAEIAWVGVQSHIISAVGPCFFSDCSDAQTAGNPNNQRIRVPSIRRLRSRFRRGRSPRAPDLRPEPPSGMYGVART